LDFPLASRALVSVEIFFLNAALLFDLSRGILFRFLCFN
jgi:hypothetical protein